MTVCKGFYVVSFSFWLHILKLIGDFNLVNAVTISSLGPKVEFLLNNSVQLDYVYNLEVGEKFKEFVIQMYTMDTSKAYPVARKVGDGQFVVVEIENYELKACYWKRLQIVANVLQIIGTEYPCDNRRQVQAYVLVTKTTGQIYAVNSDISELIVIVQPYIYFYNPLQNVSLGSTDSVISCYVASSPCSLVTWNTNIIAKKIDTIIIPVDSPGEFTNVNTKTPIEQQAELMLQTMTDTTPYYNCIAIGMFYLYNVTFAIQNQSIECIAKIDPTYLYKPTAVYPQDSRMAIINVQEPPSEPLNITIDVINHTYVFVQWLPPKNPGNPPILEMYQIKLYKLVRVTSENDGYNFARVTSSPPSSSSSALSTTLSPPESSLSSVKSIFSLDICNETSNKTPISDCFLLIEINETTNTYYYYENLFSDTYYVVRISAINAAGIGPLSTSTLFNGPVKNDFSTKEKYIILAMIIVCTVGLLILIVVGIAQCQKGCRKKRKKTLKVSDIEYCYPNNNNNAAALTFKPDPNVEKILYETNMTSGSRMFNSSLDKLLPCTFAKYPPPNVQLIDNNSTSNKSIESNFSRNKQGMPRKQSYLFNKSTHSQLVAMENSSNNTGVYKVDNTVQSDGDSSSELNSATRIKNIKNSTYV